MRPWVRWGLSGRAPPGQGGVGWGATCRRAVFDWSSGEQVAVSPPASSPLGSYLAAPAPW